MHAAKKKLLFLSSISAPYQVSFCNALQTYFDCKFWFYEPAARTRGKWWDVELGPNCEVLDSVLGACTGKLEGRYWVPALTRKLADFDPDVLMLGGFSIPANYVAYRWAKRRRKPVVVVTERSRDRRGNLRKRNLAWRFLGWLYRDADLVVVTADDILAQFRDEFRFGQKVVVGRYAADLEGYKDHQPREPKEAYTYLFANRLIDIYNPLGALDIFAGIHAKYPDSKLLMNSAGELMPECRQKISEFGLELAVDFLTGINKWADLPTVYKRSDILLLPAKFSNGNFTILEAMASGMGVIVSDKVLGIGGYLRDGINGFVCEPTTEAFTDRVERYINQPKLFREHAELNRTLVEPFSAQGTARDFAKILQSRLDLGTRDIGTANG